MAYRDSTTATGSSATPAVAVPSGVVAGDIVILSCILSDQAADFQVADWPTGFTELAEVNLTVDGESVALGWKRLTASDAGSYTFGNLGASSNWVCQAVAFSGRHATDPPVVSTSATNNSANASPVTVTANGVTALDGDDLLWVGAHDPTDDSVGSWAAPSTYTEAEDTDGGWGGMSCAYKNAVAAGATGTVAGTLSLTAGEAGWAAWLVRIPVADAGGGSILPKVMSLMYG